MVTVQVRDALLVGMKKRRTKRKRTVGNGANTRGGGRGRGDRRGGSGGGNSESSRTQMPVLG